MTLTAFDIDHNPLQSEIDARASDWEMERVTMAELQQRLSLIGYRLDRTSDCRSVARWMTGLRAGQTYPCISLRPVQISNGMAFCHFEARRDDNFVALQAMRGCLYVVCTNAIYEL